MLELFAQGFVQMANPLCIGMTAFGVFLGVMFGCVPGLNGNTALVLVLPLTYKLPRMAAFALIMGIYIGSCSGGLISAICSIFPAPLPMWRPSSMVRPWPRRGEAGKALGTGIFLFLYRFADRLCRAVLPFGSRGRHRHQLWQGGLLLDGDIRPDDGGLPFQPEFAQGACGGLPGPAVLVHRRKRG